jgi:hypothetical protein
MQASVPQAHTVTAIQPALEDCFFALLSGKMHMPANQTLAIPAAVPGKGP